MVKDRFICAYIGKLKAEIQRYEHDFVRATLQSMYDVGKVQGTVCGLELALQHLEQLLEEDADI